jgi:31-O-methyltransferase
MDYMRLPNGLKVAHVNTGETGMLYRRIFVDECYLRHGITLEPGSVIFDIGANIGMASLFFSQHFPGAAIYAFEPAGAPFEALAENMRMHGIQGDCRRVALSDSRGIQSFFYYPQVTVMSGLYADSDADSSTTWSFLRNSGVGDEQVELLLAQKYEPEAFPVEVSTLSHEVFLLGAENIGLLKIDVEKSELDVLHGISARDWSRFGQIIAEVHDIAGRVAEFSDLLRGHGFSVDVEQEKLLQGTGIYTVFAVQRY